MRILRSIPALAVLLATPLLLAGAASACTVSSAMVTGKFTEDGGFHVMSAMTPEGQEVSKLAGVKIADVTTAESAAITTSDHVGRQIWLVGDIDGEAGTLNITHWTDEEATAKSYVAKAVGAASGSSCSTKGYAAAGAGASCSTKGAAAKTASADGCCPTTGAAAKTASAGASCSTKGAAAQTAGAGASCSTKGAAAQTAGAGASCSTKGAAAKTAGAGASCSTKGAVAQTAGAGASCSTKGAVAQTAGAGASCSSKGAAAQTAGAGASCSTKGAAAQTAGACSPDCAEACGAAVGAQVKSADLKSESGETYRIVYSVSGMTCGGCEGQVQAAVAALEMDGIESIVVNHQDGTAVVNCTSDSVCKVSVQKAISGAGFPAELIVDADAEGEGADESKNS